MDKLSREVINQCQGNFPLVTRPFASVARTLETTESNIINCIDRLLKSRLLSRFGPIYNADCLGGGLTLAAMSVPESKFHKIGDMINNLPQVAHNYRRDHRLNMWFVLATETPAEIKHNIQSIEQLCDRKVYNFPKLKEYYLGLKFFIDNEDQVNTCSFEIESFPAGYQLSDLDRRIIQSTQNGLVLTEHPFAYLAEQVGCSESVILGRLQVMQRYGVIRRIGVIPNHYQLGLKFNGMSVWNVDDNEVDRLGYLVGQLDFVSHCYRRPRYEAVWPYNLFAMVHGQSRQSVTEKTDKISTILGNYCRQADILFSSSVLKKSGLRLVA